jgi:hypothetical protein
MTTAASIAAHLGMCRSHSGRLRIVGLPDECAEQDQIIGHGGEIGEILSRSHAERVARGCIGGDHPTRPIDHERGGASPFGPSPRTMVRLTLDFDQLAKHALGPLDMTDQR